MLYSHAASVVKYYINSLLATVEQIDHLNTFTNGEIYYYLSLCKLFNDLWTKSCGVTIQEKYLPQNFRMVLIFISKHFPKINLNLFVSEGVKHPHKVAR